MDLLQIIALLAPPVLAVGIYDHLHNRSLTTRKLWVSYAVFAITINLVMYLITTFLLGVQNLVFDPIAFIRYTVAASVLAGVLPLVVNAIGASINIEVRRNGSTKKR